MKLDLRQRAGRLAESLAEVEALASTDSSCATITAQVQTLQAGGLPQVAAIQASRRRGLTARQTDKLFVLLKRPAIPGLFLLCGIGAILVSATISYRSERLWLRISVNPYRVLTSEFEDKTCYV